MVGRGEAVTVDVAMAASAAVDGEVVEMAVAATVEMAAAVVM